MTTLAANGLTLSEVVKRMDPNGDMATIVEVLEQENEILQDAVWKEANDIWTNKTTQRSKLPEGTWRKLNAGVSPTKSAVVEITDKIGILDDLAKNDVDIIDSFSNPSEARQDEVEAHIMGLGQQMAEAIFYNTTVAYPERFSGLAVRLDAISATTNVLNGGGSGSDVTSIYVVDWGPTRVHMIYPRGSEAGLKRKDLGIQLVTDLADGGVTGEFLAYVDYLSWKAGLAVKNPKSIGRIANLEPDGSANIFNEDDLILLLNRMTKGPGRRIYVNQDIMTQMEIRLKDKSNVNFTKVDGLAPGPVLFFKGTPVRLCEKIKNTEADVS